MAHSFLRQFQVNHGTLGDEAAPGGTDEMYATPEELEQLYGVCPTEADIRSAMTLLHAHCNRPSLWPCEYDTGPLQVPQDRYQVLLPVTPVIQVTDMAGRYGLGRRDRMGTGSYEYGIASYLAMLGGTPQWTAIDPQRIEVDSGTGIVYLAPNWLYAPYSLVRARFIAGLLTIPDRVKRAIVEIIHETQARGVTSRTRYGVGRVSQSFSGDTTITAEVRALLSPFVVTSLY